MKAHKKPGLHETAVRFELTRLLAMVLETIAITTLPSCHDEVGGYAGFEPAAVRSGICCSTILS